MVKTKGEKVFACAKVAGIAILGALGFANVLTGAGEIAMDPNAARDAANVMAETEIRREVETPNDSLNVRLAENGEYVVDVATWRGNLTYTFNEKGDLTCQKGKAYDASMQNFENIITNQEVADKASPYASKVSYTGWFNKENMYKTETYEGVAASYGTEIAKELKSVLNDELLFDDFLGISTDENGVKTINTVIYPDGKLTSTDWEKDLTTPHKVNGVEYAMSESDAKAVIARYENAFKEEAVKAIQNEATAPNEDYSEIDDAQVFYVNNPTLVATIGNYLKKPCEIKTIAEKDGVLTIFAVANDGSVAYRMTMPSENITTSKELANYINSNDIEVDEYRSINNVFSEYRPSQIANYKTNFASNVKANDELFGNGSLKLENGGDIWLCANGKNVEIVYLTEKNMDAFNVTVKSNNAFSTDELLKIAASEIAGGSYKASYTYKVTAGEYENLVNVGAVYNSEKVQIAGREK